MMDNKTFVKEITDKDKDRSRWYTDVILKAQLADYAPVKGCMVIRPYGYAIWENMQSLLDKRFKETGHQNAYFPLLIPESYLAKESEHVEGFAPQVAWVTKGGDEDLAERLVIRPTSETIICSMYSKWIQSWRDLPVLINQWCNVMRWEKETRFFLRTTEFLWQEGHTAHADAESAEEETIRMLNVYKDFVENDLAIPVINGVKTESEKFKGAVRTYCIEALMPDGKALQAGTSHNLGQNFSKPFDIKFQDKDLQLKYVYQTSWGVSTRLIGALIMTHGDNSGLVLPPKVAPIQVVLIPIAQKKDENSKSIFSSLYKIADELKPHFRINVDDREEYTQGWKFNDWDLKGVPLRIDIGKREVESGKVQFVRRDSKEKKLVDIDNIVEKVRDELNLIQKSMFEKADKMRKEKTFFVSSFNEFKKIADSSGGFIEAYWCESAECEANIKDETNATIRCIPFNAERGDNACIYCGKKPGVKVVFAKAY